MPEVVVSEVSPLPAAVGQDGTPAVIVSRVSGRVSIQDYMVGASFVLNKISTGSHWMQQQRLALDSPCCCFY